MKNRLFALAGGLALFAVLGHFYAKPLLAQVRAALVKNIDERGRNPYIQNVTCYSASANTCTVFLPAVPAGMRLVVEHLNVSMDTPTALISVDISGNGTIMFPFMQKMSSDSAGNSIYVANQPFLSYYEAGQTPEVSMFAAAGGFTFVSGNVTFTGYLVNLSE